MLAKTSNSHIDLPLSMAGRTISGPSSASPNSKACQDQPAEGSSGAPAAERDFEAMNKAELRKAAKELGVRQGGVRVAELKDACKRVAGAPEAERKFDAMNKEELRTAAKELGVRQKGVNVAELKAACKCAVREQQQYKTLIVCRRRT